MYKRVLIALDLEGVNNVVGEPYLSLHRDSAQWFIASEQAILEVNAAAEALFDAGVEKVGLWDNHGGGNNIDRSALDGRIALASSEASSLRMDFAKGEYDCICYFGYHAMEGTLGGVLAHTMNSKVVQFYKLNGRYIGEIDMDQYIAASLGIPSCFFAGGDIACAQAKRSVPDIVTVITKKEISRNEAEFRYNFELLLDIKKKISESVSNEHCCYLLDFPATMEKSFKRTEDASKYLSKLLALGICASHPEDEVLGKDAHTVVSVVHNIDEFRRCI